MAIDLFSLPYDNGKATLFLLVLAVSGALLATSLLRFKADPREPPVVAPRIPFVGHVFGMVFKGPQYLKKLSQRSREPIATLPVLNGRMYIVSSPALASQIQRASGTLSFEQLTVDSSPRLVGLNSKTKDIMNDPKHKEEGRERMISQVINRVIHPLLSLAQMENLASTQLQHFSDFVNAIPEGLQADLFKFTSREIMVASMHTFYGPENPFAIHPELVEEFWNWEDGMVEYMLGVFPQLTARKAYIGLEKCKDGFIEYLEKGRQAQANELVRRRQKHHADAGISVSEQARLEIAMCLGIGVNAGITGFWVMDNIYSRPSLLAEIRDEIQKNALEQPSTISYTGLRDSCPLLNSVFRETMRISAAMATSRVVLGDTVVADQYLLRKGSMVQILGSALHSDKDVWGPDVDSFNARRFYNTPNGNKTLEDGTVPSSRADQVHPAAFRSFGGGSSLCPGRHFAQLEILSLAAVLVTGFDMEPPSGQDKVQWNPPMDDKRFPLAVIKPSRELRVRMTRRKGTENVRWVLKF